MHQETLSKEPKGNPFESKDWNRYVTHIFRAALFTIAKLWKQAKCPSTDKWIKKDTYIDTIDHFSAIKQEILPLVTTWRDLEGIMLIETCQRNTNNI